MLSRAKGETRETTKVIPEFDTTESDIKLSKINKQDLYQLTAKVNDCLLVRFGIKNIYHRMMFAACVLLAVKEGAFLTAGMRYGDFRDAVLTQLEESMKHSKDGGYGLRLLSDIYYDISLKYPDEMDAVDDFIGLILEIEACVASDEWDNEDVIGIFFNEFNKTKDKSENGQIFTPDHIISLMYRLIHVDMNSRILDAACGSGRILIKAMHNMINEAGEANIEKINQIKQEQLFGIEGNAEVYALACANILIHKDGRTNLERMDARGKEVCDWIRSKNITKVLMNPPYEHKHGCMAIVRNVLDSVPVNTECAFILPDKKLEKDNGKWLLKNHTLQKIIKLPESVFVGVGIPTSIFIFKAGVPQRNKSIFACYIEDDGFETVKNQGRQDVRGKWQAIEDEWVEIIENRYSENPDIQLNKLQLIKPFEHLSYQMPEKGFELFEEDFLKTITSYEMYNRGINEKEFNDALLLKALYGSSVTETKNNISIRIKKDGESDE